MKAYLVEDKYKPGETTIINIYKPFVIYKEGKGFSVKYEDEFFKKFKRKWPLSLRDYF